MTSITCRPRVEFEIGRYVRIRAWDPVAKKDRYAYVHRLVAYAQGDLDSLGEAMDVHHFDGDKWNNRPENLAVEPPDRHRRRTLSTGDAPDAREGQNPPRATSHETPRRQNR